MSSGDNILFLWATGSIPTLFTPGLTMKILLITPPFVQLNTAYPATTLLTGHLRRQGYDCVQWDMGIDTACEIFSESFLRKHVSDHSHFADNIPAVIRFLQGTDPTLATRIASREFLKEGSRFSVYSDDELEWAFGSTGVQDRAKHLATLYVQDLTDYIREHIVPDFDLIRYAEQVALAAPTFDEVIRSVERVNPVTTLMADMIDRKMEHEKPTLVGFSVPFPGCLVAALYCAGHIKRNYPGVKIVMGGGYVNTELRSLTDVRIFDYIDYLCFDDGELPLQRLVEGSTELVRTMTRTNMVLDGDMPRERFDPVPDFTGIDSSKYISMLEMANPMHRLWSDGFWNKITVAHGCYWARCAFCDTELDYIRRYDPLTAHRVVDTMESVMAQTGSSGFHFTDEALPPKLLREIAAEILHRRLVVSYWGNIRFERAYTEELCQLLASSGFIAASGGLEVASPRILKLINKGVTIEQASAAAANLTSAGIMVHAYLMYGFPTQTRAETIDSLEVVRSMFENGYIQSAFWHRFAMTIHSPIGRHNSPCNPFANNSVEFAGDFDYDLDAVGAALRSATYNYMHGLGLEKQVKKWFRV